MVMIYFSGTGNSKYIANLFAKQTNTACYSIEEKVNFTQLLSHHDTVAFCYPIYGSCVPRIMREFVLSHEKQLKDKKLIIFCTQLFFSGDGACAFTRLLPHIRQNVIYAEHFNMPNNICNFALFPVKNGYQAKKYLVTAQKKMSKVCDHIKHGVVKKRGFSTFSWILGKTQSGAWPNVEKKSCSGVKIDNDCTRCGICAKICPVKNLSIDQSGVTQHNNCITCYRCVNSCPKKAITVLLHKKPWVQYKGV